MIRLYDIYDKCVKWVHPSAIKEVHDKQTHHGARSCVVLEQSSFYTDKPASEIVAAIEKWSVKKEGE